MDRRNPSQPSLSIGALARRTGCQVETIRFYEKVDVLPEPGRSQGGHRVYSDLHLKRLTFVRRARELGFSLDEVRALLSLGDRADQPCSEIRDLAAGHLAEVSAKIADLKRMRRALRDMVESCADGTLPDCPLIDALYGGTLPEAAL